MDVNKAGEAPNLMFLDNSISIKNTRYLSFSSLSRGLCKHLRYLVYSSKPLETLSISVSTLTWAPLDSNGLSLLVSDVKCYLMLSMTEVKDSTQTHTHREGERDGCCQIYNGWIKYIQRRKEMFYLTTHSIMASDIW